MRNRQLRISAEKIDLIRMELGFFGGDATLVYGELYVRVKKAVA